MLAPHMQSIKNASFITSSGSCVAWRIGWLRQSAQNGLDLFECEDLDTHARDRAGAVMGHLAVMDTKPMLDDPRVLSVFKIFGVRAGAELERERMEARIKENEERLSDLFDEAPIAYVNEGLDSKFIRANKTALKTLGITPDQVQRSLGSGVMVDAKTVTSYFLAKPFLIKK